MTGGGAALGWGLSAAAVAVWIAGFVSLLRGPLDERRRLPWAVAMLVLPVVGSLIWLWWRHRHYPARRRAQPDWDPNRRDPVVMPPARRGRTATSTIGRPDPWAGVAAPAGLLPRRRHGASEGTAGRRETPGGGDGVAGEGSGPR